MSPPRLRLEKCLKVGENLWKVDDAQAHHLARVLRVGPGEDLEGLLEGERCRLRLEFKDEGVLARALSPLPEAGGQLRIVLLASLLKGGDFEHLLRGATETGASLILPVEAIRSVSRIPQGDRGRKIARWRRVLEEASCQCGAARVPEIAEPAPLREVLSGNLPLLRLAGILQEGSVPLAGIAPAGEVAVAIGPEGDWDDGEKRALLEAGFIPVNLGPRILKAFTAAIVACSYLFLSWEGRERGKPQRQEIQDKDPGMQDKPI